MKRFAFVLILAAALTLACSLTSGTPSSGTDTSLLFQDDFSDAGSGWDRYSSDTAVTDYADGVYRIGSNKSRSRPIPVSSR